MNRRWTLFLLCAGLMAMLCGCSINSPENLYALPRLPEEFSDLQEKINEVTTPGQIYANGADLISPVSGTNTQTVQLRDLNGDGVSEAIAFFRASGEERPLKIYIFRQGSDGYEVKTVIEGDGNAIDSVSYENVNDSPAEELLVSWQLSANVHNLEIYSLQNSQAVLMMETAGYTRYKLLDVDRDNILELLVVQVNTVDGTNRVECWKAEKEHMDMVSSAAMSMGITGVVSTSPQQGYLRDEVMVPALFVTSYFGEGCITDVFAWKDGALVNVTLDEELQYSSATVRQDSDMLPQDINGDGLMEIPMPVAFTAPDGSSGNDLFYNWRQFDLNGEAWPVLTTYHNERDRDLWYFIVPDEWEGKITVSTREQTTVGERQVIFSYLSGELGEDGVPEQPEPFLVLYKLTGTSRQTRASLGNRFILTIEESTIYAAEFLESSWDCGLDENTILDHFQLVTASYSNDS